MNICKSFPYHIPYTSDRYPRWDHGFPEERTITHLPEAGTQLRRAGAGAWDGQWSGWAEEERVVRWWRWQNLCELIRKNWARSVAFLISSGHQVLQGAEPVNNITAGLLPPVQLRRTEQPHQGPSEDPSEVGYKHYLSDNHFCLFQIWEDARIALLTTGNTKSAGKVGR